MSKDAHALATFLEPVVVAAEFDLEGVDVHPAGRRSRVVVTVDADTLDSDSLAELSRQISRALDDSELMGDGAYTLEVTSRGVDAPLEEPRHWRRNLGRLVQVTTTDGADVHGRIGLSDDDGVLVDEHRIEFAAIDRAVVEVEFAPRKDA